jgi:hypothetical protein
LPSGRKNIRIRPDCSNEVLLKFHGRPGCRAVQSNATFYGGCAPQKLLIVGQKKENI